MIIGGTKENRKMRMHDIYQFNDTQREGTPQIIASLAPATAPEYNLHQ